MSANEAVSTASDEPILDPDLPIVDAHHHLWFYPDASLAAMESHESMLARQLAPVCRAHRRYLFDEFLAETRSGHNVVASVFIETHLMYRAEGPEHLKSVGEVEVVNGVAAMSASGYFGDARLCAAIVGGADLTLGDRVEETLASHIRAGGDRYRGVRSQLGYDDDLDVAPGGLALQGLMASEAFRAGVRRLQRLGLLFEAYVLEPQIPELTALARALPAAPMILNHVGTPLGMGRYAGRREQQFPVWREAIRALAACPNVTVKLGGLGMPQGGFDIGAPGRPATAAQLADQWRPYIETCIEAFGARRCMFESNFPVDSFTCSYATVWNTFKLVAAQYTDEEKRALFAGTAQELYRISLPAISR